MTRTSRPKVLVIGLDCLEPSLLFEQFRGELPNLERLAARGVSGRLRSCDPPITVPAWSSMMSGKDPGTLGVYGFRNRSDRSYKAMHFATSKAVNEPRLWDLLGRAGKYVVLLGVPQTYPVKVVNGECVGCFMSPSTESDYTYPAQLKDEIRSTVGDYMVDVPNFRTEDKERLLRDIYRMTQKRFLLANHLVRTRPWDYFMMVEMGTDRIHHGFWRFMDPAHRRHEPDNRFQNAIRDYYHFVDGCVGQLLAAAPDDSHVLVVSDHGAKCMQGGVCINEWLIREGYLVLKEYPKQPTRFADLEVDWSRTRAWADGGYYGRVFLNVQGREPQGAIPARRYESARDELARAIERIPNENGRPLQTRAPRPEELYHRVNGVAPDLLVYFDDLRWRSVGTVGTGAIQTFENDTGPDDANHAEEGIFILSGPDVPAGRTVEGAQLMDVAPTLLQLFGLPVPDDMQGHPITLDCPERLTSSAVLPAVR